MQMPCLVGLQERPLELHVSKPCSHVSESRSHVSKPRSHVSEPRFHVSKPRSHVSEPCSHVYEPHPVGSLHFFDPDLTAPDPRLRNIRLVTLVVRRVLKRASWRTYKDNVSGMKLGCRAIEIRAR